MREQLLSDGPSSWVTSPAPSGSPPGDVLQPSGLQPPLILASTSPRRSQLLTSLGVPFQVIPPLVDEPSPTAEDEPQPAQYVEKLARAKAQACDLSQWQPGAATRSACEPGLVVIAADTVVWHAGHILNKPRDVVEAGQMLRTLRGQTHQVFTGICVRYGLEAQEYQVEHEVTQVTFYPVSDEWIERYVATGEPMDKAGAYAAQGLGALIIERIEGDFFNVVGLPIGRLGRLLSQIGAPLEMWWSKAKD